MYLCVRREWSCICVLDPTKTQCWSFLYNHVLSISGLTDGEKTGVILGGIGGVCICAIGGKVGYMKYTAKK
jgi:hypothetical protein